MTNNERAIRELADMWMVATKSGDLSTVLDLMTDDVLFMTSGREPFGKDEFRAASKGMAGSDVDGRAVIQEVEVAGDWAWVRNRIDLTVTTPGGRPIHRSGHTLTILRKGPDRSWRLFRDASLVG